MNWLKAELAPVCGVPTTVQDTPQQRRTLLGLLGQAVRSPRQGFFFAKLAIGVLKREGVSGLIRRVWNVL